MDNRRPNVHPDGGLEILLQYLGLFPIPIPGHDDAIIVSIDAAFASRPGPPPRRHEIVELGVATIDTRNLSEKPCLKDLVECIQISLDPQEAQQTYGSSKRLKKCDFGESIITTSCDWNKALTDIITVVDDLDPKGKRLRNVILVAHNVHNDFKALYHHGFNPNNIPFIVGIIDTERIAHHYFSKDPLCPPSDSIFKFRLEDLLNCLSIPYNGLHGSGNDAVYTLHALFKLLDRLIKVHDYFTPDQLHVLDTIRALKPQKTIMVEHPQLNLDLDGRCAEISSSASDGTTTGETNILSKQLDKTKVAFISYSLDELLHLRNSPLVIESMKSSGLVDTVELAGTDPSEEDRDFLAEVQNKEERSEIWNISDPASYSFLAEGITDEICEKGDIEFWKRLARAATKDLDRFETWGILPAWAEMTSFVKEQYPSQEFPLYAF